MESQQQKTMAPGIPAYPPNIETKTNDVFQQQIFPKDSPDVPIKNTNDFFEPVMLTPSELVQSANITGLPNKNEIEPNECVYVTVGNGKHSFRKTEEPSNPFAISDAESEDIDKIVAKVNVVELPAKKMEPVKKKSIFSCCKCGWMRNGSKNKIKPETE